MIYLTFIATDITVTNRNISDDILFDEKNIISTVTLSNEGELNKLCNIFSIETGEQITDKYYMCLQLFKQNDYFSEDKFEELYCQWLKTTERKNNMDEYGQLLFLSNRKFFEKPHKLLLRE